MKYRPEIDGLRAIAVLPVIFFHAGFEIFSGGYVGVDVFFVISGYLITSILIGELEQGKFSIARFYERRARRILPALFVVMLACLPFAYMWMLPSQLKDFAQSVVAVIFFASNILFWREDGYFAAAAELKPLLHTWSLAVEEQYYLLFPPFLLLAWRLGRNRLFWLIIVIALFSLGLCEWALQKSNISSAAIFYLAPTRAWELLAGSICAFLTVGRTQQSSNILSIAGLALIVSSVFYYDGSTPFPSVYALVPVVGTTLVILFANRGTWAARLLSAAPFVGIGLISYSAYLWHQPLFAFARLRSVQEPDNLTMAGLIALTLVLAWGTWRFVEQPFRKQNSRFLGTRKSVFLASGTVGAIFVVIGLAGHFGNGLEWRGRGTIDIGDWDARMAINRGLHDDCDGNFTTSVNCYTSEKADILLWGDSFAMHLVQGILANDKNPKLQQHTSSACSPILGIAQLRDGRTEKWTKDCINFNFAVLDWLQKNPSVKLVILSSPFEEILNYNLETDRGHILPTENMEYVAERLRKTVEAIHNTTNARVLIVSPTPKSGSNIGQCAIRSAFFSADASICNFEFDPNTRPYDLLRSVSDTIPVYWLQNDICKGGICDVIQDGIFIYRDSRHLSKEGSAYLGLHNNWREQFRAMAR